MNITFANGKLTKSELYSGNVDLDSDTFYTMLVRGGFSFNDSRKRRINIQTDTGGDVSCIIDGPGRKITRQDGGSFLTNGFVPGNLVWTNYAGNIGPYVITSLTGTVMRLGFLDDAVLTSTLAGSPLVLTAAPMTIYSNDEVPNINLTVTATADAAAQTLTLASGTWWGTHRLVTGYSFTTNHATNDGPYVITNIAGAVMTVVPAGDGEVLVDTGSISYVITNGYTPAPSLTVTFTVTETSLTMLPFNVRIYEPAIYGSRGAVVYDSNHADNIIIVYMNFRDWTLNF